MRGGAQSAASRAVIGALAAALPLLLLAPPLAADPSEETPAAATAGDPDYAAGRNAVAAGEWERAVALLAKAVLRDNRNADIHNYLAFAYRHVGDFAHAFAHYEEALRLNPRHRGAHEYIGEAYLLVDQPQKAEEHLAALRQICLLPCEELDDLAAAVDRYHARLARAPAPR